MAESPHKPSSRELANENRIDRSSRSVYPLASTPRELHSNISSSGGDVEISRHSAGSDQTRSSRHRRGSRASQHQQLPSFPSLNSPPESSRGLNPPLHAPIYPTVSVQYPPHPLGRPGQYMVSTAPPLNMTHSDYPIITSYSSYDPETAQPPSSAYVSSFRYPPAISPVYPAYQEPPATYPPLHVHPGASFPQFAPQSAGRAQEGDGGTWYYVPSQQQQPQLPQQYNAAASAPPSQQPLPTQEQRQEEYDSHIYAHPSTPRLSSFPSSPVMSGGRDNGPIQRRPYHPNPPGQRSEWVMWAGNVPSDADRDELWRFLTAPPGGDESNANSNKSEVSSGGSGVVSIFIISRSNCAFVNYETEAHLQTAIERFNGVLLRQDPRFARLLCRVRNKDEDLRAGVGGQRGIGLHREWVKAKEKERSKAVDDSTFAPSVGTTGTNTLNAAHSLTLESSRRDDHDTRPPPHPQTNSSSSGSQASTNSSLLQGHFPQRFFILKSHTQDDLELSVRTGVWATQLHNESVLDRAFRNSENIFLIFSVNKSGEFYGYAQMAGLTGEATAEHVTWAARSAHGGPPPVACTSGAAAASAPSPTTTHHEPRAAILSDEHFVDNSPAPITTPTSPPLRPLHVQSAPPDLEKMHHSPRTSLPVKYSLDQHLGRPHHGIDLNEAYQRNVRATEDEVKDGVEESDDGSAGTHEEGWGRDFRLDWLCTERLSFQHTRHLRNPWNHNREVKVSRDGTELEPSVGQSLLEEWHRETQKN